MGEIGNCQRYGGIGFGIAGLAVGYLIGKEAVDYATSLVEYSRPDVLSYIVAGHPVLSEAVSSIVSGGIFSGCGSTVGLLADSLIEGCTKSRFIRRYMREMKEARKEMQKAGRDI